MDITKPVMYREVALTGAAPSAPAGSPVSGIRLTRARFTDVSVHGYTEKRSLDDGFDASDVFLGMRRVVLEGEVFAVSKADLFDALDVMRLIFTPTDAYNESPRDRGYLPLTFEQATTHLAHFPAGYIPREIRVRPSAQPEYTLQFAQLAASPNGMTDDGYVCPFVARLEAKDPRFYGTADITSDFTGTGTSGTVRNRGNYPAPVSFVLGTTQTAEQTFHFVGLGTDMTVKIPAGTGLRTVVVDGNEKVATLTIGTDEFLRMDLVSFAAGTTWPKVPPTPEGSPLAAFTWSVTAAMAAGSRLLFREAWA